MTAGASGFKTKLQTLSLERLYHLRCGMRECQGWWSIGDAPVRSRDHWFCPWCGTKNEYDPGEH